MTSSELFFFDVAVFAFDNPSHNVSQAVAHRRHLSVEHCRGRPRDVHLLFLPSGEREYVPYLFISLFKSFYTGPGECFGYIYLSFLAGAVFFYSFSHGSVKKNDIYFFPPDWGDAQKV